MVEIVKEQGSFFLSSSQEEQKTLPCLLALINTSMFATHNFMTKSKYIKEQKINHWIIAYALLTIVLFMHRFSI